MNKRIFRGLLVMEAAGCVLFHLLNGSAAGIFSAAVAFPLSQIGAGLRALSLSGGWGNALAITLYVLVCLLPAGILLILGRRRKLQMEDWLLAVLSAVLFFAVYLMVNPGLMTSVLGAAAGPSVGKAILGGMAYSLLIGYLILRALRLFSAGSTGALARYMTVMLGIVSAVFVYLAFGARFAELLSSIASLQAGNTGNGHLLGTTYVFLGLQYVVNALPYLLDILVVFAATRLLSQLRNERYAAATVAAAERMSRLCTVALIAMVLANMLFNLLQLLFAGSLMVVNHTVQIPVLSVLFVLAALLLTRFITESKQLKDENDQFI